MKSRFLLCCSGDSSPGASRPWRWIITECSSCTLGPKVALKVLRSLLSSVSLQGPSWSAGPPASWPSYWTGFWVRTATPTTTRSSAWRSPSATRWSIPSSTPCETRRCAGRSRGSCAACVGEVAAGRGSPPPWRSSLRHQRYRLFQLVQKVYWPGRATCDLWNRLFFPLQTVPVVLDQQDKPQILNIAHNKLLLLQASSHSASVTHAGCFWTALVHMLISNLTHQVRRNKTLVHEEPGRLFHRISLFEV